MRLTSKDLARILGSYFYSARLSASPHADGNYIEFKGEAVPMVIAGEWPGAKLVLIHLSQIKYVDAVTIGKILVGDKVLTGKASNSDENLQSALAYIGECAVRFHFLDIAQYEGDHDTAQSRAIICDPSVGKSIMMADYLRSKGYHIPFMGQDLFELGVAIKAQKPW